MKEIISYREDGSRMVTQICEGESMTQQQHASECDINNILKRYASAGLNPLAQPYEIAEGILDYSAVTDYQTQLNAVLDIQDSFSQLPSTIRRRFSNDPAELLHFLSDDANLKEAISLGLVNPKPESSKNDLNDQKASS